VLIVAAPIKRAYIWDLTPSASAIHYLLHKDFHVHLLEWLPVEATDENGLAEYAESISECVARISSSRGHENVSDWSLPRRHACGNIRSFRIGISTWFDSTQRTIVLPTWDQPFSGRVGVTCSISID
jgi:hypothetical protein